MRWATRVIEAPDRDDLSAAEVAVLIGYRDAKSVLKLVEEGHFPAPVEADGKRKWLWEDVVWFNLHKRIRPRLKVPSAARPKPNPGKPGRTRENPGSGEPGS